MARLITLAALAALAVAEVAAVIGLAEWVGPTATLTILALDVLLGVIVMRWAVRSPAPGRGWRLAGGTVIALPGLVLDVVGFALLIPGVQAWLSARVLRGTESALRAHGMSVVTVTDPTGSTRTTVVPGDVVPGQVVDPDEGPAQTPKTPPDTGGVVRGEILRPEESG